MPKNTSDSITIGAPDVAILRSLNKFHFLTASQTSRLLYPGLKDNNRYAQRLLKRLVDVGLVLRLRDLPKPVYGSPPHIFTLARRGRAYLMEAGIETTGYFRPSEEEEKAVNRPFMQHTLSSIDVLITAELVCRTQFVSCPQMLSERELKRSPARVEVAPPPGSPREAPRSVAVIPDGWFQLEVSGHPPISIALELDRGTEEQKFWRRKVATLIAWIDGPYEEAFDTNNVTIAIVTPSEIRRDQLRVWTKREIANRGLSASYEDLFLFTCADPVTTAPESFFFDPLWYLPSDGMPISLLDPPKEVGSEAPAAYA